MTPETIKTVALLAISAIVIIAGIITIIVAIARGDMQKFIKEKMAEAEELYKDMPKPDKSKAKLKYVLDAVNDKYKITKLFMNIRKFIEDAVRFHNSMNGK